jgi:hypothetical protein
MSTHTPQDVQLKTHQELPPMTDETYRRLVEDIKEYGLEYPVVVDEESREIVDGHHRYHAALEAGVEPKIEYRTFDSNEDRTAFGLRMNVIRRDLGPATQARLYKQYEKSRGIRPGSSPTGNQTSSREAIAQEMGLSKGGAEKKVALAKVLEGHKILANWVDAGKNVMPQKWATEIVKHMPELSAQIEAGDIAHKAALEKAKKSEVARKAKRKADKPSANGFSSSEDQSPDIVGEPPKVKDIEMRADLLATIPPKKVSDGQLEGLNNFERYHALIKHDPEEVAKAFDPERDPDGYAVEVQRTEEVIGWMERYQDALLQRS